MSPAERDAAAGRQADGPGQVPGQRGCDAPSRQRGASSADASAIPPGQLGHGMMAVLRRQPLRPGRVLPNGGTRLFELICGDCGDHLYLDYSEVPARLQWLRGPRTIRAALAAYERHLGLTA